MIDVISCESTNSICFEREREREREIDSLGLEWPYSLGNEYPTLSNPNVSDNTQFFIDRA